MTEAPRRRSPASATLLGGSATIVGLLPVFLTGAMAVQMTEDLRFGIAALGASVALYRMSSAIASVPLGRLADRLGATWSLRIAALIAVVASLGIATTAQSWLTLVPWMMFGSCANSLGQPAANRMLLASVPARRLGLAFGLKQAAVPAASMASGASVPLIALTIGWRWAFAFTAILALLVLFGVGGRRRTSSAGAARKPPARGPLADRGVILLLAVAFGLSTAASSVVPVFYVTAAVTAGSSAQFAGSMLAIASAAAITARLLTGALADRMVGGHLRMCAVMLVCGSVGLLLLASGRPTAMAVGAFVSMSGTWGFNAVFWYSALRAYPAAPGRVTGALAPGGLTGSTLAPVLFGLAVERLGYPIGWNAAAAFAVAAAAAMVLAARRLPAPAPLEPDTG